MTGPGDPAHRSPLQDRPPGPVTAYPFALPVPIRTERLVLRPWRSADDADRAAYRRLMGDPDVVRYLYNPVLDAATADRRLTERAATIDGPGGWMDEPGRRAARRG